MDNIREKLAKLIEESRIRKTENEGYCICGSYIIADHLLVNGVTVQEWIPVSEPPKKNGRYYVHFKMHDISYVKIASFSKESVAGLHDNGWHDYDSDVGFYEVKDVTHWMPLPSAPKGE